MNRPSRASANTALQRIKQQSQSSRQSSVTNKMKKNNQVLSNLLKPSTIEKLPQNLLVLINRFLEIADLFKLLVTSRTLNKHAKNPSSLSNIKITSRTLHGLQRCNKFITNNQAIEKIYDQISSIISFNTVAFPQISLSKVTHLRLVDAKFNDLCFNFINACSKSLEYFTISFSNKFDQDFAEPHNQTILFKNTKDLLNLMPKLKKLTFIFNDYGYLDAWKVQWLSIIFASKVISPKIRLIIRERGIEICDVNSLLEWNKLIKKLNSLTKQEITPIFENVMMYFEYAPFLTIIADMKQNHLVEPISLLKLFFNFLRYSDNHSNIKITTMYDKDAEHCTILEILETIDGLHKNLVSLSKSSNQIDQTNMPIIKKLEITIRLEDESYSCSNSVWIGMKKIDLWEANKLTKTNGDGCGAFRTLKKLMNKIRTIQMYCYQNKIIDIQHIIVDFWNFNDEIGCDPRQCPAMRESLLNIFTKQEYESRKCKIIIDDETVVFKCRR